MSKSVLSIVREAFRENSTIRILRFKWKMEKCTYTHILKMSHIVGQDFKECHLSKITLPNYETLELLSFLP